MPGAKPRSRRFLWVGGLVLLVLAGIVFALGSLRVGFIKPESSEGTILLYVLSTLVFLSFIVLGMVLARSLLRLYAERRQQVLGTKFKTKMVVGALALSLLPAVVMFFVSYALLNRTLAKWFPRPLEIVRDDAREIVGYLMRSGEARAQELAHYLAEQPALRQALAERKFARAQEELRRLAVQDELAWVALTNAQGELVAASHERGFPADFQARVPSLFDPRATPAFTLSQAVGGQYFHLARVPIQDHTAEIFGAVLVATPMPTDLQAKVIEIESESQKYAAIEAERKTYRWQALLILLLITGMLLFAATWAALYLSKQVTVPIQALALATHEVSRGNFTYRIETPAQDELGTLVDSFNRMTAQVGESRRQLEASRHRLEAAVAELEQRRQLMEAILESIPTGVITLNQKGDIVSHNPAAARLAGRSRPRSNHLEDWVGTASASALGDLLDRAARFGTASRELEFRFPRRVAHMAITVSALRGSDRGQGFVVVLDDLTELLRAQKAAAWQEVAQRIAHEIKNPLTPIQLSADRIRRYLERYPKANKTHQAGLRQLIGECTAQIALEVNGLKTLVDEFSRFARFPTARLAPAQLNQIVESTLAAYREVANGIALRAELDADLPEMHLDADLLRRALMNLIENALEALTEAPVKGILICTRHLKPLAAVELSVADSGRGIPAETKPRLFLPFFSTKPNGMGLGLAIVDRIVSEHHGVIRIEDNEPSGTRFVIELPTALPPPA
ncbi:MAG: ATP-binding protein [Terriglobia bacterium]